MLFVDLCKRKQIIMKASELRLGNYVYDYDGDIITIERGEYIDWVEDFNPIPLTEEWLVRFGFDKPAHSWCGDIFHLCNWDRYPDCWSVALNKNNAILVNKLKYVHQLQNIYFALTGQELTTTK